MKLRPLSAASQARADRFTNFGDACSQSPRLLELLPARRTCFAASRSLAADTGKAQLAFELTGNFFQLVFVQAGITRAPLLEIDAAPCNVHVRVAARLMMKRDCPSLPFKPKLLFNPVGGVLPLFAKKFFIFGQPDVAMEKWLRALRGFGSLYVHVDKGGMDIG